MLQTKNKNKTKTKKTIQCKDKYIRNKAFMYMC